jgi:16S rRNA (adenine1518-N6/adenine1519-N6)-dimethyltransferase
MVRPKKSFGQHFLKSKGVVEKIADSLEITPEDTLIEIGPGTGILTEEILKRKPKKLILIELDKELIPLLEEKFGKYPDVEIINADATEVDFCKFGKKLKLVGNLPYNVGSLIVLNTVYTKDCVDRAVYMLQKEVAEKLTLKDKKPSWLGIFLNTFFDTEYLMSVPARFFHPPPKVTSAVIKLEPKKEQPNFDLMDYQRFLEKLFSERRKMLKKKLPEELLVKAGIKPTARVEELTLEDFIKLYSLSKQN